MQEPDEDGWTPSVKTMANKRGFLAGALNAAVAPKHIPANPCADIDMPRDDDPREMVFLSRDQFAHLHSQRHAVLAADGRVPRRLRRPLG